MIQCRSMLATAALREFSFYAIVNAAAAVIKLRVMSEDSVKSLSVVSCHVISCHVIVPRARVRAEQRMRECAKDTP